MTLIKNNKYEDEGSSMRQNIRSTGQIVLRPPAVKLVDSINLLHFSGHRRPTPFQSKMASIFLKHELYDRV